MLGYVHIYIKTSVHNVRNMYIRLKFIKIQQSVKERFDINWTEFSPFNKTYRHLKVIQHRYVNVTIGSSVMGIKNLH